MLAKLLQGSGRDNHDCHALDDRIFVIVANYYASKKSKMPADKSVNRCSETAAQIAVSERFNPVSKLAIKSTGQYDAMAFTS